MAIWKSCDEEKKPLRMNGRTGQEAEKETDQLLGSLFRLLDVFVDGLSLLIGGQVAVDLVQHCRLQLFPLVGLRLDPIQRFRLAFQKLGSLLDENE